MIRAEMIWLELSVFRGMVGRAAIAFVLLAFCLACIVAGRSDWAIPILVLLIMMEWASFVIGLGKILEATAR
jgi:ABC-type iron transport system FetAB permease component